VTVNKKINALLRHVPKKYHKNFEEISVLILSEYTTDNIETSEEMFDVINEMYGTIELLEKSYTKLEEDYFILSEEYTDALQESELLSKTINLAEKEYILLANEFTILEKENENIRLESDLLMKAYKQKIEVNKKSHNTGVFNLKALEEYWNKTDIEKSNVFYFEIDKLQSINTSLGKKKTDKMLSEVSSMLLLMFKRLTKKYSRAEILMYKVGSAFIIITNNIDNKISTKIFTEIKKSSRYVTLNENLEKEKITVEINFNIGFCPYQNHKDMKDLQNLIYAAKHFAEKARKKRLSGHAQVIAETFNKDKKSETYYTTDKEFNERLHMSIKNNFQNFEIHYQPQVCLEKGVIHGYEALLRWKLNKNDKKYVNVGMLIEVAEETGAIIEIGEWVIEEVCKKINVFKQEKLFENQKISINLSGKQLLKSNLEDYIINMTTKYDIAESEIGFEITESIPLNKTVITAINTIATNYKNIAMDDFGTGCASLEHISDVQYNSIKIDKKFVDDVYGGTQKNIKIIQSIFDLAKKMNASVIIEGIEEKEDKNEIKQDLSPAILKILEDNKCIVQGYYFSEPKPYKEMIKWHRQFYEDDVRKDYGKYFNIFNKSA